MILVQLSLTIFKCVHYIPVTPDPNAVTLNLRRSMAKKGGGKGKRGNALMLLGGEGLNPRGDLDSLTAMAGACFLNRFGVCAARGWFACWDWGAIGARQRFIREIVRSAVRGGREGHRALN